MKLVGCRMDGKHRSGWMEIVPEHQEDIYVLSRVISIGDMVRSGTTRKVKIDGKTQQKIFLMLKIKVESISVDLEGPAIYLKGKTTCMHEHIKLGSYHTIEVCPDRNFELEKEEWTKDVFESIKDATKQQPEMVFIVFYERECVLSTVSHSRVSVVLKQNIKNRKFPDIIRVLEKYIAKISIFVIASASEVRNEFYKVVSMSRGLKAVLDNFCVVKVRVEYKGYPNSKVIDKILTDKDLSKRLSGVRYVNDLKEADSFLTLFARGSELACIGMSDIKEAMSFGALEKLIITDEEARPNNIERRREMETFCKEVQLMSCKVSIVPAAHFSGERLKEIGGVGAILRFNYR